MPAKVPFDAAQCDRRSQEGPCFVCSMLAGHPDYTHHQIYQDADTVAFLVRWPTLLGHCLVAPKRHVENWVHDLQRLATHPEFRCVVARAEPGGPRHGCGAGELPADADGIVCITAKTHCRAALGVPPVEQAGIEGQPAAGVDLQCAAAAG